MKYFRDKILEWQHILGDIELTLKLWITVQSRWASLVTIFLNSADIRQQLPQDTKRFESVHSSWKTLMNEAQFNTNCVQACSVPERVELLKGVIKELEICQKSFVGNSNLKIHVIQMWNLTKNFFVLILI